MLPLSNNSRACGEDSEARRTYAEASCNIRHVEGSAAWKFRHTYLPLTFIDFIENLEVTRESVTVELILMIDQSDPIRGLGCPTCHVRSTGNALDGLLLISISG